MRVVDVIICNSGGPVACHPAVLTSDVQVKQQMLGHSHELMTIYCQHASDGDRPAAADKVGEWLNRAASEA